MTQVDSTIAAQPLTTARCASQPRALPMLSLRANFIWALAGNLVFAACQWGALSMLAKLSDATTVGRFSLGLAIADGPIHAAIADGGGFVHGFTWSHHPVGAAVGLAVLERIVELRLVDRARTLGERLLDRLAAALDDSDLVGEVRGRGLLLCVELVQDRESKKPFPRSARVTEQALDRAMDLGLLLYPSTGNVDGTDGDYLLIGPPLTVIDDEIDLIVDRLTATLGGLR